MAGGGMSLVALQSCLDRTDRRLPTRNPCTLELGKTEHVEITALSEEKSFEAAQILQERHLASKPLKAYAKACSNQMNGQEDQHCSKLKKADDDRSPLMRTLLACMPILTWMPKLNARILKADIIAGLTVGVMVIPQSMSYGAIAGLPYIHGMYSACVPTLIYAFFGQSKQLAVGPVAMVSLLVHAGLQGQLSETDCPQWYADGGESSGVAQYEVCSKQYVNLACLTAAVVGVMQILGSILRLGFLVSFLGHPVTSGFTSGAAIIIGLSQLKDILGYDIEKSQFVYVTVYNIVMGLGEVKPLTVFLGLIFFIYLVGNKKLAQRYKRLRMLQPLGPLVSCVVGSLLLLLIPVLREDFKVKHVGHIPDGLMPISIGGFKLSDVEKVLPTAMSACLIGYMESIAIGKSLAAHHGYEIDAGQEMLALGISNLVGSIFSCYPVTGSFSRSAVNNSTGGLSQLSGIVTAAVMFLTLMVLTPLFYYLPKFVLAAIVLNSVIPLVAIGEAKRLWRVKRNDFLLWVVAFIGTLFLGVLMGIVVAVSLSLIIVIYESARPQLTILWRIPGTTIYRNMKQESSGSFVPNVFICRIGSSLYFANASFVKDMLLTYVSDLEDVNPTEYLVLEMTPVITIDSTACHVIRDIVADFRTRGIEVAFAMVGNRVDKTMRKSKLKNFIGDKWFFATVNEAVQYCLRHQHAKMHRIEGKDGGDIENLKGAKSFDLADIDVGFSDEIGFSNDMHSENTMVFITLVQDLPMSMSEITAIFKQNRIIVVRAQIEPLQDEGAKHTYFLTSQKTGGKLSDNEIERVRDELESLVKIRKLPESPRALASKLQNDPALAAALAASNPDGAAKADDASMAMSVLAARERVASEKEANARLAALEAKLQAVLEATGASSPSVATPKAVLEATAGSSPAVASPKAVTFDLESGASTASGAGSSGGSPEKRGRSGAKPPKWAAAGQVCCAKE